MKPVRAWAWAFRSLADRDEWLLCRWAEADRSQLARSKPTCDARMVRVTLTPVSAKPRKKRKAKQA